MDQREPRGKIIRLTITYELAGIKDGDSYRFLGLPAINRYQRPERVEEVLADLQLIVEDLIFDGAALGPVE